MNTFTKILIVAVALINVAVSVLFIQMTNVSSGYSEMLAQKTEAVNEAVVAKNIAQNEAERAKDMLADQTTAALTQAQNIAAEMQRKDAMIIALKSEIARQENLLESLNAKLAGLEGSVAEQVKMTGQLSDQLGSRIAEIQDLNEQLRSETLMRQEAERELQSARQHAQVKQTLLMAAEDKIRELNDKIRRGAVSDSDQAPPPVAAVDIEAEIIRVIGDQAVATINVGTTSGVQKGMKFMIHRGNLYVGDFTVEEVEPDNSSGTLSTLQTTPMAGDQVVTVK